MVDCKLSDSSHATWQSPCVCRCRVCYKWSILASYWLVIYWPFGCPIVVAEFPNFQIAHILPLIAFASHSSIVSRRVHVCAPGRLRALCAPTRAARLLVARPRGLVFVRRHARGGRARAARHDHVSICVLRRGRAELGAMALYRRHVWRAAAGVGGLDVERAHCKRERGRAPDAERGADAHRVSVARAARQGAARHHRVRAETHRQGTRATIFEKHSWTNRLFNVSRTAEFLP
jgi:hypothetical protein